MACAAATAASPTSSAGTAAASAAGYEQGEQHAKDNEAQAVFLTPSARLFQSA